MQRESLGFEPNSADPCSTAEASQERDAKTTRAVALQPEVEDLRRQLRELSAVAELHRPIEPPPSLEHLLAHIIDKVDSLLDVEGAGIMLFDPDSNELVLQRPAFGVDDELIGSYHVPLDTGGNAVTTFLTGEPYLSNDSYNDPRFLQSLVRAFNARTVITVPLTVENRRIGVLHVCNKRNGPFDQSDLQLLYLLSDHLASLIENARLLEREKQRVRQLESLNQFIADQRDKLERAMAIHERFTQIALQGNGIDGIIASLAHLVDNPIAVEDKFFRLISYAPYPNLGADQKARTPEFQGTPSEMVNDSRFRDLLKSMKGSSRPAQAAAAPQLGLHWGRAIAVVAAGNSMFGYLSVFEKTRQLGELDLVAVEHAATVLALEMQKQKTAFEVEQRLKGDFLDDLLTGNYDSSESILRRAAFFDYDLSHPHVLMIVDIDRFGAFLNKRASGELEATHIKRRLFETVHSTAVAASPKSLAVSKSDSVIVLVDSLEGSAIDPLLHPERFAETLRERVKARLPKLSVSVAVGGKCECPEDYQRSYHLARKSLELLKAFNQGDRVVCFDRPGVYQLLLEIENKSKLRAFVDHFIGPLLAYDKEHNSSLVETLESYLQNDCNLYKTARVNYLHVSTVRYRFRRIEEIARLDLSDAETRLNLHLGLKVRHLME